MPRYDAMEVSIETENIRVMICGDPGTGKSIFASSFPTPGLVFDFAKGALSYKGTEFTILQFPVTAPGWVEFESELREVKKEIKENKYRTIVVDDVSTMCDLAMQRALTLDPKRNKANGPLWNVHYQIVKNLVEGRLRQIMDFEGVNIVFVSHLDVVMDGDTGAIVKVEPMMTGQLSTKIPGLFDEVYYASTKRTGQETKWQMQTVPIGFNRARSRLSGKEKLLPDFIPNDYMSLIEQLNKTKK